MIVALAAAPRTAARVLRRARHRKDPPRRPAERSLRRQLLQVLCVLDVSRHGRWQRDRDLLRGLASPPPLRWRSRRTRARGRPVAIRNLVPGGSCSCGAGRVLQHLPQRVNGLAREAPSFLLLGDGGCCSSHTDKELRQDRCSKGARKRRSRSCRSHADRELRPCRGSDQRAFSHLRGKELRGWSASPQPSAERPHSIRELVDPHPDNRTGSSRSRRCRSCNDCTGSCSKRAKPGDLGGRGGEGRRCGRS